MPFVECDRCAKRPGSPTLCGGCIKNRELIAFRERENERLQARLAELILDKTAATKIRNRLIRDIGPIMDGAHYIDIVIRYEGGDTPLQFDWVKELLK